MYMSWCHSMLPAEMIISSYHNCSSSVLSLYFSEQFSICSNPAMATVEGLTEQLRSLDATAAQARKAAAEQSDLFAVCNEARS